MKNTFKLLSVVVVLLFILNGCSGSRQPAGAGHNHRVDNRGFRGY